MVEPCERVEELQKHLYSSCNVKHKKDVKTFDLCPILRTYLHIWILLPSFKNFTEVRKVKTLIWDSLILKLPADPDDDKVSPNYPSWVKLNFTPWPITLTIKGQQRLEGWNVPLCFCSRPAGLVFIWSISELWPVTFWLAGRLPPWENADSLLTTGIPEEGG